MQDGTSSPSPRAAYKAQLESLRSRGLYRHPLHPDRRGPPFLEHEGVRLIDFTSNDYLGLSFHPACILATCQAVRTRGCGAASSKAVTGNTALHGDVEQRLSRWLNCERAQLFASGYQANVGVLTALGDAETLIFSDERNHASIVDGCRLSAAEVQVYPHRDVTWLRSALQKAGDRRCLVVTDALFSMNGNLAPLAELHGLCQEHGALLVVDEAHSVGMLGPQGQGLCAAEGIEADVRVVTFSKSLGSHGAAACSDAALSEVFLQRARSLIYSTALPPPSLGATLAALRLAEGAEGERLRSRVLSHATLLRDRLEHGDLTPTGQGSPIVSLSFSDEQAASRIHEDLMRQGLLVWPFRPPTVPDGTSLLRMSITADHTSQQVELLASTLHRLIPESLRGAAS